MKPYTQIGILKTVAIAENYQHRGIGSAIMEQVEKIFLKKGIHVIACVAWRHGNIENIGGVLHRNGYRSQFIIDKYWEEDSLKFGFSCPVCGDHGCVCAANIYTKAI